jgi:hypothetical protein
MALKLQYVCGEIFVIFIFIYFFYGPTIQACSRLLFSIDFTNSFSEQRVLAVSLQRVYIQRMAAM